MLPTARRRLISPRAFTTRCHGNPEGQVRNARPTIRARRGQPSHAAICPYVTTRPRGMLATCRHTRR